MRAINLSHFELKLMDKARELYREHGWRMPVGHEAKAKRDPLSYGRAEGQQAKRAKADPKALKALFLRCWERSDSRAALAVALLEHGLVLAQGDRRSFVAVDSQGELYALSRWLGVKAKDVHARLGDGHDLPTVEAAKALLASLPADKLREAAQADLDRQQAEYERRRRELAARQRLERKNLFEAQRQRGTRHARALRDRLPKGWRAAWAKASGQYHRLLKDNAARTQRLWERDRAERQHLVLRQLEEHGALRPALQQLRLHREIGNDARRRATGRALAGLGTRKILPQVDPRQPLLPADGDEPLTAAVLGLKPARILNVLARHDETFSRADIERALARYFDGPRELRAALDEVLRSNELVRIGDKGDRFTTATLRNARSFLERQTSMLAEDAKHFVGRRVVDAAIAERDRIMQASAGASLSAEQEAAIRHVTGAERLSVVVGFAGAGKSTLLAAARSAWQREGYRVIGAALSGKAAAGLEDSSGIASRTLAAWEHRWDHGMTSLGPKDVLVIDEAGMIGTLQLAKLVDQVRRAGAKLVLVGDPEQLQPIAAGTPFREMTRRLASATLMEIRRQKEDWQRQASLHLARQEIGEALRLYEARGCIKAVASRSAAVAALVQDYMQDCELHGAEASRLALAHRRQDVHLINQTIRAARRSAGELADERLFRTVHGPRAFAAGDRILLTRNDRSLGLHNGVLGTVESIEPGKLAIRIDGEAGETAKRVTIAADSYASFDHGYATTIHKAQGATVDRTFLLASGRMDGHMTYVGLTRHRQEARLYGSSRDIQRLTGEVPSFEPHDRRRERQPQPPRYR
ncbi:MAG TPA: AAA family ATPase, partial [Geminicoccaceae bacterium]|nr:AAA family ATPase [Geminicoccus sp.]HMU53326.1 AAA family ATPase [Geminicoccaceae bacterium]